MPEVAGDPRSRRRQAPAAGVLLRRRGLTVVAVGDAALFLGLASGQPWRAWLAAAGSLALLGGLAAFLATLRGERVSWPDRRVALVTLLAAGLHVVEGRLLRPWLPLGWALWSLPPYGLCLAVSAFPGTRGAAAWGALAALAFDLLVLLELVRVRRGFGAAFLVLFRPVVSTLAVTPLAIVVARALLRRRPRGRDLGRGRRA
jgi:hypothetical protein